MNEFDLFGFTVKNIVDFCDHLISTAKLCGISKYSAFVLLIISEYADYAEFFTKGRDREIEELLKKDILEVADNNFKITSKGAIIVKSLNGAKEKFNTSNIIKYFK